MLKSQAHSWIKHKQDYLTTYQFPLYCSGIMLRSSANNEAQERHRKGQGSLHRSKKAK